MAFSEGSSNGGNAMAINESETHNIILSYLMHNCFIETAESFINCAGMKQPAPANYIEDMDKRKRILYFALNGEVLKAIELTEQLAPDLLENNTDLYFDLLSLHFVELVCSRKCTEAVEFAEKKLTSFGKVQKYCQKLEDFMALLAYEDPAKSPMFHLLSPDYRQQVADSLNRAILGPIIILIFALNLRFSKPAKLFLLRKAHSTNYSC